MRKLRIPLIYQHLLFYIILLVIPVVMMGYMIHFHMMTSLKEQVTASNKQKLTQLKDIMDTKLLELHDISMQVSTQPELTPYNIHNFYDVFKAKKLLNYKVGNDFIYDLLYYIRDGEYIYSGATSYTVPLFLDSHYRYKHWPEEEFYHDLNHSDSRFLRYAEEVELFNGVQSRMITYGVPIPLDNQHPYATLLFLVKEKVVKDMLRNVVHSPEGNALILDGNQEIVTSLYEENVNLALLKKEVTKDGQSDIQQMKIGEEIYFISHMKSQFLDWTYVTLTPESDLMKEVNDVRNKVLASYVVIFGTGALLIYFGMYIHYRPLQRLILKVSEKWRHGGDQSHGLEKVWGALQYTDSMNQMLSERVESSRPVLQQHLLIRLLRGEVTDAFVFNRYGAEINLMLKAPSYFVMLLDFPKDGVPSGKTWVDGWLEDLPAIEKYQVDVFEPAKTAVIMSGEVSDEALLNWYQKSIKKQAMPMTVGVGNRYDDVTELGKSHLEAATALDYKLIKGVGQMIFFHETSARNPSVNWYDKRVIEQLELFLRQKDKQQVEKIIEQIVGIIKSENTNLFMAKCLSFDVSSTVMRMVHDRHRFQQEVGGALPDVLHIHDFHSVEAIEETVTKMIQAAFRHDEQVEPEMQLIDELLDYINENYHDYDFSIQALASHFSLSESYIMRYFKKQTGDTILQHLNRLRMDRTKQLLETTDLPIKEIVTQVGYSDISSFIRRFKQSTQMTPGEYRKAYAKKKA